MSIRIHPSLLSFSLIPLLACGALSDKLGDHSPSTPESASSATSTPASNKSPADSDQTSSSAAAESRPRDANHEEYKAYHALVTSHRDVLKVIADVKRGELAIHPDPAKAAERLADLDVKLKALTELTAVCDKFRGLRIMDLEAWQEPEVACANASDTGAVLSTLAQYAADRYVASRVAGFESTFATLEKGYGLSNKTIKALLAFDVELERKSAGEAIAPLKSYGADVDVDVAIGDVRAKRDQAFASAPAASRKFRYTGRTSGQITVATKQPFASMKTFKIIKTLAAGDWNIRKHRSGVPSSRVQRTQVVGKLAGEPICRLYEVELTQSYAGAGRWAKGIRAGVVGDIRITECR